MSDLIDRQAAIETVRKAQSIGQAHRMLVQLPSAQPEIVRCCKCGFWDRDTLRHQFNDFRDWNEAECMVLAERDPYHEMDRYTEADDYCSRAERRTKKQKGIGGESWMKTYRRSGYNDCVEDCMKALQALPPVQPG